MGNFEYVEQEPDDEGANIKVVGIGGAGGNAINHMIDAKIEGVEFIAVNTDTQDLHHSAASKKIHIGKNMNINRFIFI